MPPARPLAFAVFPIFLLVACSAGSGDPPAVVNPDPLGTGARVRDVTNPNLPTHPKPLANPVGCTSVNDPVRITGATILWNDIFDETGDGKSRGTIYVQDIGPQNPPVPYSGIGLFNPAYVPADLRVAPGDVLDFNGPYEELTCIGSAHFAPPQVLTQLASPVGTFRYEYKVPDPAVIDANDLNDYDKGRQWLGMLVKLSDVTVAISSVDKSGRRVTYPFTPAGTSGATISNELYDMKSTTYAASTHFKSVTGIVTWFFSYHIAPRTCHDLECDATDAACIAACPPTQ